MGRPGTTQGRGQLVKTLIITAREAEIIRLAVAILASDQTPCVDAPARITQVQRDTLPDLTQSEIIDLCFRLP